MLVAGGRPVGGARHLPGRSGPPHWNVFWLVEDVDATVAQAADLGWTLPDPPRDMPGVGRLARLADRQGARSWVMQDGG